MPEATIDEDDQPESREDEIRTAGEVLTMLLVFDSSATEFRSNSYFRPCAASFDPRHNPTTRRLVEGVRHQMLVGISMRSERSVSTSRTRSLYFSSNARMFLASAALPNSPISSTFWPTNCSSELMPTRS
jgi:hypothetical protein